MIYYTQFVVCNLIFDYSSSIIYKRAFDLRCKNSYLVFLQTLSVVVSVLYLFCLNNIVVFILLKLLQSFLVVLLTIERYSVKNIFIGWFVFEIILFATIGLYVFLGLFYYEVVKDLFKEKIAKIFKYFAILIIFLQYLIIFCVIKVFSERKKLKQFLAKIEFNILSEHIKIVGLIDSGNMLYDEKTKLPVVVVSIRILRKYVNKNNYELITTLLNHTRRVECLLASGERFMIPVIDISNGAIESGTQKRKVQFVIGILDKDVYDTTKYECLLHRDFV